MTAPLTGAADAPDVPASPMPATAKPAIKIVRIMISPLLSIAPPTRFCQCFGSSFAQSLLSVARRRAVAAIQHRTPPRGEDGARCCAVCRLPDIRSRSDSFLFRALASHVRERFLAPYHGFASARLSDCDCRAWSSAAVLDRCTGIGMTEAVPYLGNT